MNEEELANLNDNVMQNMGGFGAFSGANPSGADYEERSRHTYVSHAAMSQEGGGFFSQRGTVISDARESIRDVVRQSTYDDASSSFGNLQVGMKTGHPDANHAQ